MFHAITKVLNKHDVSNRHQHVLISDLEIFSHLHVGNQGE